ncbi:MAG: hypothetical protein CVV33_09955 [Methanomicrobiales archaeon HGW-Methanomicrobiales-4]|nr:MAG: hypothetical protein CVV33_09955 [Methanomicrobiales archaeon HGW-Methanomicrobiales-4]
MKTGYDLWRTLLLLWTIAGLITGGALIEGIGSADQVITSATTDGSVMSSSAYLSGDTSITSRIFGSGLTTIDRETGTGMAPSSLLQARSDGSLLIGTYAAAEQKRKESPVACVFGNATESPAPSEIEASGILWNGSYSGIWAMQPFESITTAHGTGILDLRHHLAGNTTLSGRTIATGNLSVIEHITTDQGESP